MKRANVYFGTLLLALVWSGGAMAAVCTSLSAGDWNVVARWSCGHIPVSTDTVVIAHNAIRMRNNYTVAGITINAGAVLNDDGNDLTVNGNVVINGQLGTNQGGALRMRTAGATLSGTGIVKDITIEIDAANITLAAGSTLDFDPNAEIDVGANMAGSLIIDGTVTAATQTAGDRVIRVSSGGALTIGTTGVVNAPNSRLEVRTNASVLNNGNITVRELRGRTGTPAPVFTQGANSNLTLSIASCVATSPCTFNASAAGNTVTYNGTATVIPPSAGYWNLAGTIFPGACPHGVTVLGADPCPAGGPTSVTLNPSNCVNVAGIGTLAWGTTANAVSSNNAYATRSLNDGQVSNFLRCTGYGFAIPAGSTINGITVKVERRASVNNSIRDAAMRLVMDVAGTPTIQATDRSTLTNYTTADVIEAHGGAADLWGGAWTVADINSVNFGAAFSSRKPGTAGGARTVSVDHMPITVIYTPPVAAPHHIRIVHNGGACSGASAPAQMTIIACANAACTAPHYIAGNVTGINLSPTGAGYTWAPVNPQTITSASGGINSGITLARSAAGTATLAITGTPSPAPSNAYECYNDNTDTSGDCNLVFTTNSFVHNVPNHTSDSRQVVTLTSCKGSFASTTRSIKFWSTYVNPATGAQQGKVVAGTGNVNCATGYSALGTSFSGATTLNLAFGAGVTPQATFSLCYPDAGRVQLDTRYDGSAANTPPDAGTVILGVDLFTAVPHHFTLSNITCGNGITYAGCIVTSPYANPGAANAAGAAFMRAGNPFSITVTAQNTNGVTTPNFGKESVPESVTLTPTLIADSDLTFAGTLSGTFGAFGAVTNGVATGTAFSFDEVGIMTLTARLASASYLGSGIKEITTPATGNIGRFTPDHFDTVISEVTPDTALGETTCDDGFTYSAQPFIVEVTARTSGGGTTQNYQGSYARAVTLSDGNAVPGGALNNTAIASATFSAGIALTPDPTTAASPNYTFTVAQTAPATIKMRATENAGGDGISSSTGTEESMEIRSGRLVLGNAHGSELLGLTIPIETRYWTAGGSYARNADDDCTMIPASSITMGAYTKNLAACETQFSPAGDLQFTAGLLPVPLRLSAPGANNDGSVDLLVNVGTVASGNTCLSAVQTAATAANVPWLTTNTARATFGVYKGSDKFIYQRENY